MAAIHLSRKDRLLSMIREGKEMSLRQKGGLTLLLALPAIIAQMSTVLMSYIDSGMVGRLGSSQAAAIGLVSTSVWVMGGFCLATAQGFSVQIAHLIGRGDFVGSRKVVRQGLLCVFLFSILLSLFGLAISAHLPRWLGGGPDITSDAVEYFRIYSLFIPAMQLVYSAGAMLQASGNMKIPSVLEIIMCILDVIFNYILIFQLDMGVRGAALGTGIAEAIIALFMLGFLCFRSPELNLLQDHRCQNGPSLGHWHGFRPQRKVIFRAWNISGPLWLQNVIVKGAYVASTLIVAPLGTIAIAANSFAITAESFCYMPGYGLQDASTTLVGQSIGAGRQSLARSFAKIAIALGAGMMTFLGILMYLTAPHMMGVLTPDPAVISLGARVLRIEAFAETFFGVSIVAYGCCVGAGDTKIPALLNLLSMWVVRIGLALILTPRLGLAGYWLAMCIELNVRGVLFLLRVQGNRWMKVAFMSDV